MSERSLFADPGRELSPTFRRLLCERAEVLLESNARVDSLPLEIKARNAAPFSFNPALSR
jgi:hypothetical protein